MLRYANDVAISLGLS